MASGAQESRIAISGLETLIELRSYIIITALGAVPVASAEPRN